MVALLHHKPLPIPSFFLLLLKSPMPASSALSSPRAVPVLEQRHPCLGWLPRRGAAPDTSGNDSQLRDAHGAGGCHEKTAGDGGDEKGHAKGNRSDEAEILDLHRFLVLENKNNQQTQEYKADYRCCPDKGGPGAVLRFSFVACRG